jgi:hypothetical protein
MSATDVFTAPNETRIDGPTHCHLFLNRRPVAYCGVPREEQQRHGPDMPVGDPVASVAPFCPFCGLPRCPVCAEASWKRAHR